MARRSSKGSSELDGEIDDLYCLPLTGFTAARNALAARLKQDGDREASERVRALAKPVFTAWIVNRLQRDQGEGFDRLLEAGDELRTLQTRGAGDAEVLQDAMENKREAVAALLRHAESLAVECGVSVTRATLRRIEVNLDAVASYGDAGPDQRLGRMTADLEPPGFEALLTLAAAAPRRTARTASKTGKQQPPRVPPAGTRADQRKLERARVVRDKARKEFERRELEAERAARLVEKAKEREEEMREMVRTAERGLRLAQGKARRAERELADATTRSDGARETLQRAREQLTEAEAGLKSASKAALRRY